MQTPCRKTPNRNKNLTRVNPDAQTSVGLQELADEPEHLRQDFTGRQSEPVVQQEVLDGVARGTGQVDAVEQAGVQRGGVEARGNQKLQHHVELIRCVDLKEKKSPTLTGFTFQTRQHSDDFIPPISYSEKNTKSYQVF